MNDQAEEGVYRWSDDGTVETHPRWNIGEPNNGRQYNCGSGDAFSKDENRHMIGYTLYLCSAEAPAICKIIPQ